VADVIEEPFERVLPKLTDANRHFWQGGATGRLHVARCGDCGLWLHPSAPVCPACWSRAIAPQPVSGRGRVYSFTINRYEWVPGFEPPYLVASVELDEQAGLRFVSNVIECPFDAIRCGLEVEVVFARHGAVYLPLFRPVP
jgi:uncharacterized OB-fold protein